MKRFVSLLVLLLVSLFANAYECPYSFKVNGIFYVIVSQEDKTVAITCAYRYNGVYGIYHEDRDAYKGNFVIPESVLNHNGVRYRVVSIDMMAFYECLNLKSVTIPNSVTSIGDYAFNHCSNLSSVTIPNNVTSIGKGAFGNCTSLTSVTIPNSVTSIDGVFSGCSSLTSVTIPNSVTSIGDSAFKGCISLTSVTIPNSVASIGDNAFNGCSNLSSVTIPNNVTSIGKDAFGNCTSLTSVTIPNSVTFIDGVFVGCSSLTSVTIPNSVTLIGERAFNGCSNLSSVTIPNNVTSIGMDAFSGCTSLTSVTIPNSVTSIDDFAFWNCGGLTSVTIGNGVTYIGKQAFCDCKNLAFITFGNSLTQISYYAFSRTAWYENQPNGVVYAGTVAYDYKGELPSNTHINIKDGTLGIANSAFQGRGTLVSFTIPNSVTSIGDRAFADCRGLASVTIGNSVKDIGSLAFYECKNLTSISIPNSVTTIGSDAFYGCNLSSITIPNSVTSIGARAFMWCNNITSVTIGKSVTSIGEKAFYYCSLSSITSLNPIPPQISVLFANGYYKEATLYVPKGSGDAYRNAKYWNNFSRIIEIDVPSESSIGDSNGDGNVDYADIEEIKNYIMGSPSSNFNTDKADYNGDGVVNVADIVSITDNNKWITVTDNFSKSIPFTKIRVLNNKSISDQYCCVAFSTSPNEDVGTDRFYINFSTLTIGDNNPTNISWGNPITNYKHVGGNWYEYEFSCPVYFAFRQHNCPSGQVKVCIDATYTQLDYIERDANHTAIIYYTGVTLNNNMKFQLKVYPTNGGGGHIIGNHGLGDKDDYRVFWAGSNEARDAKIYFDYGDDGVPSVGEVGRRLLTASTISNLYELEVGNYYVKDLTNNNYILSGSTVTNANVDRTIGVFGNNDFGRIYYLKVFDGNTLIKNLIPVRRDCDGFVTLYDTISKTYLNTIAGTFKASDE